MAIQVVAFTGVKENVSRLARGMISTAQEFGAAIGLAVIATAAATRSANADVLKVALADGFRRGAVVAAGFSIAARAHSCLVAATGRTVYGILRHGRSSAISFSSGHYLTPPRCKLGSK